MNILSCRVPALEYLSGLLVWPNVPCDPNWAFRYFDNFGYFENLEYCGFSWKFLCFGENTHDEKFGSDLFGRVIVPYDTLKELVSEVSPKLPQFSQDFFVKIVTVDSHKTCLVVDVLGNLVDVKVWPSVVRVS